MSDLQKIFVDGIANLSYSAGAFRFDLASLNRDQDSKDKNKMAAVPEIHVIMTPQAFIQSFKAMENFVKLVEEKGIIRFNEQSGETLKANE